MVLRRNKQLAEIIVNPYLAQNYFIDNTNFLSKYLADVDLTTVTKALKMLPVSTARVE